MVLQKMEMLWRKADAMGDDPVADKLKSDWVRRDGAGR